MSMIGNFLAISTAQEQQLRARPESVEDFLYSDEVQESESLLDVDKAWHAVHFLLTGSPWGGEQPLKSVVLGGEEIGEDAGYGPARLVSAETVRAIDQAIAGIDKTELEGRFDADALNKAEIYPEGWGTEDVGYVSGAFEEIKEFYRAAATNGDAVLLFIN